MHFFLSNKGTAQMLFCDVLSLSTTIFYAFAQGEKNNWVILPQACVAVCSVSAVCISTFLLMVALIIFILACDSVSILAF